jgi:ribosomal protein L32
MRTELLLLMLLHFHLTISLLQECENLGETSIGGCACAQVA